jgi:SpoVK/Ycf46/Vps4 family AAA+-type ATPase
LVAEELKKTLIRITFGDLGEELHVIERNLVALLKLATRNEAVVLIDEADPFLAERLSKNGGGAGRVDYNHDAIVSIFLRQLECFSGVMFLTTNQGTLIDAAVHSRVIPLQYPPLSAKSKAAIWRSQLLIIQEDMPEEEMERICVELAEKYHRLDGREIKKLARLASTVSQVRKKAISGEVIDEMYELAYASKQSPPDL